VTDQVTQFPEVHPAESSDEAVAVRLKNEAAIRLLKEWMADESGYDEETWPKVKQAIEANCPSYRSRFGD